MAAFQIRKMTPADWPEVHRIYSEGISTGYATFELSAPSQADWDNAHIPGCRFVAESSDGLLGWVALSPVSGRCVYGGVAEVSVYVSEQARGRGIGKALMEMLISSSELEGYWTLQAGIFPENTPSIRLHEKVGFRLIGRREKIGKRNGVWYDNVIYERRSKKVGID